MTAHVYVTRAWSCTVRLAVTNANVLPDAAADLDALLARVDRSASRFRADSSLSVANANAGRPVPIPRLLSDLVKAALDAAAYTEGAVDPTVGLAMHRIGYDRDIAAIPQHGPAITPSPAGRSWPDVRLHREAGLLTVPRGTALDLGATAKAYTVDYAARTLYNRYGVGVLVEIGGDLATAGVTPTGWPVHVAEREGGPGQVVVLSHGGMATSTTTVRHWRRGGQDVHHIVDPRTGEPATGPWRTASVYAPSALAANTASTAAIVLGDAAVDWLTERRLAARLVHADGAVQTTPGWPAVVHKAAA
ncbi:MAG TPA: FAD:protein FMN transferase [Jatrophihabitantaceae bacterium]|nr:FAD:protein FMN transferase [Jatrophihabitantaceae bacterium]